MTKLLLDTGILGKFCHPNQQQNRPVADWLHGLLLSGRESIQVFVPEIADYELRRKLLHLIDKRQADAKSILRLDDLGRLLDYLPLDTETMRCAAELWAAARGKGQSTAGTEAIDGDVILAAQAILIDGTIVTTNRKHLSRFVATKEWSEVSCP